MDLFDDLNQISDQPLAHRMRPRVLSEYIGQQHIIGKGRLLRRAIQKDQLSSIILYGPPGTGKTTLARVIANTTKSHFSTLNAVLSGVKELRYEIEEAKSRRKHFGKRTILFIDEVHRWNKSQQDALLPHVENGTCILIGATTENPYFEVNPALVSRSRIFQLLSLSDEEMGQIAQQALDDKERGYGNWSVKFEEGALEHLIKVANGDARSLLNALELAIETEEDDSEKSTTRYITRSIAEESIQKKAVLYDKEGDYHFDTISAFIKSIRGSDPDAALYWMAKMVSAGEDPSFIFRRLLISATEDVGLADPNAIKVVLADAQAFDRIGLPEGRFHLSHAAIYLAIAPKSNSTMAFFDALKSVEKEKDQEVPNHLKDGNRDAKGFGHGQGYVYPHAFKDHWVAQQYLPSSLQGHLFYYPSNVGYEGEMQEKIIKRREAQNEVALDTLPIENLTTSPTNGQQDRWIQRMLSQQGQAYEQLRNSIFSKLHIVRHENILVLNPGHGFLVWQALREVPEGSVSVLTQNEKEIEYLTNYSATLDELQRPQIYNSSLSQISNDKECISWEKIVSFNSLSTLNKDRENLPIIYNLLTDQGVFATAQIIPSLSTRLSSYAQTEQIKKDLERAESILYSKDGSPLTNWDIEDLLTSIKSLGWSVEYEKVKQNQKRVFTADMIGHFINSSYRTYIKDEEAINSIIDHLCKMLCNKEVEFSRVFLILRCSKVGKTY
jgi:putative ATPase